MTIKKSGFTLVELLLVMGIMGILMTIFVEVFGSILNMKLRSQATSAIAQDSRYLLSRLSYDISRASDVILPTSGNSGNVLSLNIQGDIYTYQLVSNTLTLSINSGPSYALTGIGSKINTLSFTHFPDLLSKKGVQINLNIAPTINLAGGAILDRQLTTTIVTR